MSPGGAPSTSLVRGKRPVSPVSSSSSRVAASSGVSPACSSPPGGSQTPEALVVDDEDLVLEARVDGDGEGAAGRGHRRGPYYGRGGASSLKASLSQDSDGELLHHEAHLRVARAHRGLEDALDHDRGHVLIDLEHAPRPGRASWAARPARAPASARGSGPSSSMRVSCPVSTIARGAGGVAVDQDGPRLTETMAPR